MEKVLENLHFLKEEAPYLLARGDPDDIRKVLRCRLWVDRRMAHSKWSGYAWWLLVKGDVNCALQRKSLRVLSLAESIELGAVCPLSWHSAVWQKFQKEVLCGISG